ncbi:MAG: hypothetical protein ACPIOQ_83340, partial [Promethearchaeia archaeon]
MSETTARHMPYSASGARPWGAVLYLLSVRARACMFVCVGVLFTCLGPCVMMLCYLAGAGRGVQDNPWWTGKSLAS